MIDLRTYSDKLFRIDEVLRGLYDEVLRFDKSFFYEYDEVNKNHILKTFDIKEPLEKPLKANYREGTQKQIERNIKDLTGVRVRIENSNKPYYFSLKLDNPILLTPNKTEHIRNLANAYKNVRSVLEGVEVAYQAKHKVGIITFLKCECVQSVRMDI